MRRRGFTVVVVVLLVGCTRLGFQIDQPASDLTPLAEAGVDQAAGPDGPAGVADGPAGVADGPSGPLDVAPTPDAASPDLPPPDHTPPQNDVGAPVCGKSLIGKPCKSASMCGTKGFCLVIDKQSGQGFCSCPCTQDDLKTPLINEDSCPDHTSHTCGDATALGTKGTFCFLHCKPQLGASDCAAPLVCQPGSGILVKKPDKPVCVAGRCTSDNNCPVYTGTACTSRAACGTGEACLPLAANIPIKRCAKPGKCDLISGLCGLKPSALSKSSAMVGDPCTSDLDCGEAMVCRVELDTATFRKKQGASCTSDDQCCSGTCQAGACTVGLCTVMHRNGYCTIRGCNAASTLTIRACPTGSSCNRIQPYGGQCQRTCALSNAASCRGHAGDKFGDYECRAWDQLVQYYLKVADTPVCDFGPGMPCNFLSSSALDCSAVGLPGNTTQMTCRSLANKPLTSKDPTGFCLDSTPSGTGIRSPLPTP